MRRTIVAIDAIHSSLVGFRQQFGTRRSVSVDVFSNISLTVFDPNPGDYLPVIIGSDKSDFVGKVHVPVYSGNGSTCRITSADIYQHPQTAQRILLVISVMAERLEFVPIKLRGPVTLFTSVVNGRQGVYGRRNRFRNFVEGDRIELIRAGDFRLRISAGARSYMAFDASHPRVCIDSVCDEFGFHRLVAGLSAKLN